MREGIGLYRGKRKDNGEWVEGSLLTKYDVDAGCVSVYYIVQTFDFAISVDYDTNLLDDEIIEVIPETVGEYMGLTDKNGKKIFEGDIVKGYWDTIVQVVYDDCYLGFRAKEKDGMHNCIDYYGLDRIEVIGNIHDNHELLQNT